MKTLPEIKTKEQLCGLIEEIGFIPLFSNNIRGFSVMDLTRSLDWFEGDAERDPWEWREGIAAEGNIAYGKLFSGKMGFISKKWYPSFANYRRNGYDFDALYEEGLASRRSYLIMKLFSEKEIIPSYEIKRMAGFGKNGEKGFEGALARLQMQTYLTVRGFECKRNRAGGEYGWATGLYSTAEALFGGEHVRSEYSIKPEESKEKIMQQGFRFIGQSEKDKMIKLLG